MKKWFWGLLLLLLAPLPLRAADPEPKLSRFEYEEPHMGTRFRVVLYAPDKGTADRAAKAAFQRVADLNGIMSDYNPASELMRLCKKNTTVAGEPVTVSEDLFFVLQKAQEVSKLSDGAFDVTVGPLVRLWRHARKTQQLPDPKELARAKELVGYKKVELGPKKRTVRLLVPGMQLDLGGIAKGYAADEALKAMARLGVTRALVAAGGDIAVSGAPPGTEGWRVEIAPLTKNQPKRYLRLRDAAVSTSGDAEQFVEINGVRYSHIVDPRTGLGLTGRRSVSVVARKGITSDSMTKALSILPPEKGLKLIEDIDGAAALIVKVVDRGEDVIPSKRFAGYLDKK